MLDNAPGHLKLTSPRIQKDIISAAAIETTSAIVSNIGEELFSILVDEAHDASVKEQTVVALRFVDREGSVIKHIHGVEHVVNTSSLSLKAAIESLFSRHGLSMSSLRGQGYDGASNMQGKFNGLKILILKENESAFYVHCFAHQLQLTLGEV